jgi:DNA polymerase-3 subunit delta
MNLDVFDGKNFTADQILDAAQTVPFMSERRLVLVRGSHLFASGRKADSERLAVFVPDIPDTAILLFIEDDVDRRGRLFKKVNEAGLAVEMKAPSEKELLDWVTNMCKKRERKVSRDTILTLLRYTAHNMESLANEMEKLFGVTSVGAEITREDIEAVCTPALETRIFDLVDAVGNKRPERALDIFSNMLLMKEQPLVILVMIARQFRLITQSKALAEKMRSASEIAALLCVRVFIVTECLRQANQFTSEGLLSALRDCLEADINIKSGRISDKLAVETLIIKYASALQN